MADLRLQVLLSAIDKITTPFRSMQNATQRLSTGITEAKKALKSLEQQQGHIEKFRELSRMSAITGNELQSAKKKAADLATQFNQTATPTKELIRQFEQAKAKVRELKDREQSLTSQQQKLREEMQRAGINVRSLSTEQQRLRQAAAAATQSLSAQREQLARLETQHKRLQVAQAAYAKTRELQGRLAGTGAGLMATGAATGLPVIGAIKEYSSFENAMKGVAKQVDGARDSNGKLTSVYYDMAKQIKAISEDLPQVNGAIDIASLIEGAARMGVQGKDNLLNFAKTAAKAATAFELPADQLAEDMGKIANLYKIPISNIEQLGDAINFLDDNAQSKGADIINVMQRLGGIADKLDFKQAAALGSTFLSLGSAAEVAASASNAMVRELSIATMQGEKFAAGLDDIGLKDTDIERRMTKDSMGTIIMVLEKIKALKPEAQLRVTTQLFGKEFGDDAAKLANNLPELHRQLALTKSAKSTGSMQRESDIDKNSLSSQWMLLQAGLKNVQSAMGETLRGSLMDIISYMQKTVGTVRKWIEANPELSNRLMKTAAAIAVVTAGAGALALSVAAALGPFAMLRFSAATLGLKLPILGSVLKGITGVLGLVTQGVIRLGIAMLTNPVGLAIMGIVAVVAFAAAMIYKHWAPIKAFMLGVFEGISSAVGPLKEIFAPLEPLFGAIVKGLKMAFGWFTDLLEPVKYTSTELQNAGNMGKAFGQFLADGINLALAPLKLLIEGIKWVLDNISKIPMGEGAAKHALAIGNGTAQASGYVTGNYGQTPSVSNYQPVRVATRTTVIDNTSHTPITINQTPGMDANAVGKAVRKELQAVQAQQAARARAKIGDRD